LKKLLIYGDYITWSQLSECCFDQIVFKQGISSTPLATRYDNGKIDLKPKGQVNCSDCNYFNRDGA
jgi:hypothetical protein